MRRSPTGLDLRGAVAGMAQPGLDTRSWNVMARVDDDPDAIVWDADLGWIVDVTIVSGPSAGDGPVTCRVASSAQGPNTGRSCPVHADGLVIVSTTGDPNEDAIIIGQLHDTETNPTPTAVNGDSIVETSASDGQVAADVTHISVLPDEDLDEEWRNVRITADGMVLGTADADQSFARGDDLADAIDDFADAIDDFCDSLIGSTPAPPNAALTVADVIAAATPLKVAVARLKAAKNQWLSSRIKGD